MRGYVYRLALVGCALAFGLGLAACRRNAPPLPDAQRGATVKLGVAADGVYEIPAETLRSIGMDGARLDPSTLTLSSGGQPVSFQGVGAGRQRALRFFGQAQGAKAYTAENVYWLAGQPGGEAVVARPAALALEVSAAEVISFTTRVEEQRQWLSRAAAGDDRWMWQTVFAPTQVKIGVALPHARRDAAQLRVGVWANSSAPVDPDHHWLLSLNGIQVADVRWDGVGARVITATVPADVLVADDNQFVIRAPGDTGAPADSVFLDWIELSYNRELVVDGPALIFSGRAAGYAARIKGPPALVWDITDPTRPVALQDYRAADGVLRFSAPADGQLRRFAVVMPEGVRQPAAATATSDVIAENLRHWPGGADLMVVTASQFRGAFAPLIQAREAQGLRVAVVDVAAVYDTFSAGRADPQAIQALVQQALTQWAPPAPRFLLLAGDASYDPRGYLKGVEVDWVPTGLVDTAFTGWTASDVWYALPPDVGLAPNAHPLARPLLAVGRLPAQTPEQMAAMVAKILAYEQQDAAAGWRQRAFFAADNDEPAFTDAARAFAHALPGYDAQVVTVDGAGVARAALHKAWADGAGLVGYFGHGSLGLWAQEKILSVEDVAKLSNRDRLPVVMTLTCLSGFFEHPTTPSLGESLLRAANGGAVAVIAPSSASVLDAQAVFARGLAAALSAPDVRMIGEAMLRAQLYLVDAPDGINEILLTYNLLGDPTLRIK